MKVKRPVMWMLALIGAVLTAVIAGVLHDLGRSNAQYLQACMQVYPRPFPWLCEKYLYRFHPTPQEVAELNTTAGARLAFYMPTESDARRLLKHYLDAGVDINAVDQSVPVLDDKTPRRWTALHMVVLTRQIMAVKVLLEFGASREIRDAKGRTPLDLARELQAKDPGSQREQIIRLLEANKS